MPAPVLIKPIPAQVVNEQAAYGPFDLHEFVQSQEGELTRFRAELSNGQSLPRGMICTSDGMLTGIPSKGTQGDYELLITAENAAGSVQTKLAFTIKSTILSSSAETDYFGQLKSKVWEALEKKLPVPDLEALYNRPINIMEVYYLLERWATLKIWDAFNLDPPGTLKLLQLEGASEHYHVYDRGSCLVAVPKDLFSHERTLLDGLQTARAMAREVYKRGWAAELVGFDKLTRATWVELQHLGNKYGKLLEIVNYQPTPDDLKIYYNQTHDIRIRANLE